MSLGNGAWQRKVGSLDKLSRMQRVSMTTLWVTTTRDHHTEKNFGNWETYHILTMPSGMGRGGDQISENCPEVRNREQNDLTFEAELWTHNAPAHNPWPPHTPTLISKLCDNYAMYFHVVIESSWNTLSGILRTGNKETRACIMWLLERN